MTCVPYAVYVVCTSMSDTWFLILKRRPFRALMCFKRSYACRTLRHASGGDCVRLFCRRRRLQQPQAFAAAASRRELGRACTKLVARAGRQALGALGASPWASRRRGEWLLGGGGSASSLRSCALLLVTPIDRLLSTAADEVAAPAGRRRLLMAAPRTAGKLAPPGLLCLAISADESGSQLRCRCGGIRTAPARGVEARARFRVALRTREELSADAPRRAAVYYHHHHPHLLPSAPRRHGAIHARAACPPPPGTPRARSPTASAPSRLRARVHAPPPRCACATHARPRCDHRPPQ